MWFVINKAYSERRLLSLREATGLTRNLIIRYTFNIPINLPALQDMLMYKYVVQEDLDSDESSTFKKLVYNETDTLKWRGDPPRVEIVYDSGIGYLLKVSLIPHTFSHPQPLVHSHTIGKFISKSRCHVRFPQTLFG
jgi:hypothetical protein